MGERVITDADYKIIETGVAKVASSKQAYQRIVITKEQVDITEFEFNMFRFVQVLKHNFNSGT